MPYLTPETLPAETVCIQLDIPNDRQFVAAVLGALQELTYPHNWEQFGAITPEQAAAAADALYWKAMQEVCGVLEDVSYQQDVFARYASVDSGAWTRLTAAFATFGYCMLSDTTAFRFVSQNFTLPAGTYHYTGLYAKGSQGGIHTVTITDSAGAHVLGSNIDQFGAFTAEFTLSADFTLEAGGECSLAINNSGNKNPSSSGYAIFWIAHHFLRTA